MTRTDQRQARAVDLYAKGTAKIIARYRRRHPQPEPVERETVEQWMERTKKSITQCEPITGDPAAAIQRARGQRAELKFPRSPKNTRSTT